MNRTFEASMPRRLRARLRMSLVDQLAVDGEVRGDRADSASVNLKGLPMVPSASVLRQHGAQEVLLAVDAVEVALEQAVAHPDVLQRALALEVGPALLPLLTSCWVS